MSLLREIQTSVLSGNEIGPILLKLRFLAARLGSVTLEEWVRHESEGYPHDVDVPNYRKIPVSYVGNFSGPFGSGIRNAPIPPYLIEKFAGEKWTLFELRQGVSAIDDLLKTGKEGGNLHINASNLILLLQGKVYEGYACNSVEGTISKANLAELQNAVRNRILELTLEIEKSVPSSAEIGIGPPVEAKMKDKEAVTQITQHIIHGNVTTISNSGSHAHINVSIAQGDKSALIKALTDGGIPKEDADELAAIIEAEAPESKDEPFGTKTKAWITKNLGKAASGGWKIGISVATSLITEAALRYYGLK